MRKVCVFAVVLLAAIQLSHAAFWRCELQGGVYLVNLGTISSVSIHEYIVDGAAVVTEATISTTGAVVARFYYLEMLTPRSPVGVGQSVIDKAQEKAQELADRTGQGEVLRRVVKNYPTTTHAHTVEYRVDTKEQVKKIYNSLEVAWRANSETSLRIP